MTDPIDDFFPALREAPDDEVGRMAMRDMLMDSGRWTWEAVRNLAMARPREAVLRFLLADWFESDGDHPTQRSPFRAEICRLQAPLLYTVHRYAIGRSRTGGRCPACRISQAVARVWKEKATGPGWLPRLGENPQTWPGIAGYDWRVTPLPQVNRVFGHPRAGEIFVSYYAGLIERVFCCPSDWCLVGDAILAANPVWQVYLASYPDTAIDRVWKTRQWRGMQPGDDWGSYWWVWWGKEWPSVNFTVV